jgi:hypothetical protein
MLRAGLSAPLGAAVCFLVVPAAEAASSNYQCDLRGTSRRVELRYDGAPGRPPCEVVYHKETEQPGVEQVLWTAQRDVGFCRSKADALVGTLEDNGWRCSGGDSDDAIAAQRQAAPIAEPPRTGSILEPPQTDPMPEPPPSKPPVQARLAPPETENGADQGPEPERRPPAVPDPALEAAVARDLARLKTTNDAVEAQIGQFGDLNGDGIDDAAVLITFDAEGTDHAQYLVAYVAQDSTYRPAASRFIGGRYRKVFDAEVAKIERGQITLELRVLEPDDPYCCPSGSTSASYTLENGELVSTE